MKKTYNKLGEMPLYGEERLCFRTVISKKDIEVDKAKVDLITNLPSP